MRYFTLLSSWMLLLLSFGLAAHPSENRLLSPNDSVPTAAGGSVEQYGFQTLFLENQELNGASISTSIHPQALGFVQDYLDSHGKSLQKMKTWGTPYFTLIENILTQYGLPNELKYLAVIESGLNTHATSWAGAKGPWQFMPYTAKEYGLTVTSWNDERTDYFRSTHAAARYLTYLYTDLKDWLLVIAAYNGGPGKVYNAIKKSGSRDFWKLQYHLPAESRSHVKKFIATHYIMEGKGGTTTQGRQEPVVQEEGIFDKDPSIEKQAIAGKFSSVVMAKNLIMDLTYFNQLNPNFDATLAGNEIYVLRLPKEKMMLFNNNRYPILSESIQLLMRFYGEEGLKEIYPKVSDLPEIKKKTTTRKIKS